MLAQPAEFIEGGGEIATWAEEKREEWVEGSSAKDEGGGEAGHSFLGLGYRIPHIESWG